VKKTEADSSNDRIAEARERLRAFWAGGSLGRPAVAIRVTQPGFQPAPWTGPDLTPKQRDLSAHCRTAAEAEEAIRRIAAAC